MNYTVDGIDFLILSIIAVFTGAYINRVVPVLKRNNIPEAVTGGLIFSLVIGVISSQWGWSIEFDMRMRDILLLVFFTTIGLTAKFRLLLAGGKSLVILLLISMAFLILQNATGVLIATSFGGEPAYGLFVGSISLAGGHGTAIAWGAQAAKAGLEYAEALGITFATFGLIMGGIIGGPIAGRLISANNLKPEGEIETIKTVSEVKEQYHPTKLDDILKTALIIAICLQVGDLVNRYLFSAGVLLPGFLTAMLMAIGITNAAELFKFNISERAVSVTNNLSLQIFLVMSLISMQFAALSGGVLLAVIVMCMQVTLITLFTMWVVFRLMGRDYDAAVMASGFAGLGLGATPVAIGNMNAITNRFGPSPKAFLVVPLVGAFFIDIANALILKVFLALPMMEGGF
ncbi:sodium/glutamate symporter [Alkalimarinus sediminis]|uniref:Sodium/glutamate symporter n=1 Tax=Alkalimarinus sediminis TaxID=1632866 RepID=A0A9E8HKI5_9ALTE|nr:sodium/glutamate symporter [Alkalimarinus sediminis]UZW74373.1 sodium/glutamate symporter [Alkalimarinus sediminis]